MTVPPEGGSNSGNSSAAAVTPPPAKTENYSFTLEDAGVPIQFKATNGPLTGTLLNPLIVAGKNFMANKSDSTSNPVMIIGPGGFMHTLSDPGASVIVMSVNGGYIVMADHTP